MRPTRRKFVQAGATALCGSWLAQPAEAADSTAEVSPSACLDYGLSFICHNAAANAVRFWVESRTTLWDDQAGTATTFYQCASCKSENTFAERDLFQADNYDFLPIFGGGDVLTFRRPARLSDRYREVKKSADILWGPPTYKLREAAPISPLDNWEQIRDATAAGLPLVTQTESANADLGLRAVIECPTKTMNIQLDKRQYQVDTGPIAFPDLTKRFERAIECLSLAFIAFNAPDFADFVIEQPTPIVDAGKELGKIYHYSQPFSLPAKNRVLAIGKL